MLGWTDRHARFFLRQISANARMYSEMLHAEALVYGDAEGFLKFHPAEHPVAFQLGGNRPENMAKAARMIEQAGFDEVNLNCGCPSERGHADPYGAHLMAKPELVRDCLAAMRDACSLPVSIKTRIGIDRQDSYEPLAAFAQVVVESGCKLWIVHARKAWLDGLSTQENRHVPPLHYDYVYRLKREFPELTVVINGAIDEWPAVHEHLQHTDGVMVGRRAYKDPFWLREADAQLFGATAEPVSRAQILRRCLPYLEAELTRGAHPRDLMRHTVGLFRDLRGASNFRRHVSVEAHKREAGLEVLEHAIRIADWLEERERVQPQRPRRSSPITG